MKLGVIACLHGNLKSARKLFKYFNKSDIDALVFAGDTNSDEEKYKSIRNVFEIFSKLKIPIFAIPGSHESYAGYKRAIKQFKNITDCSEKRTIKFKGHDLVFMPGSDSISVSGTGFILIRAKKVNKLIKAKIKFLETEDPKYWKKKDKHEFYAISELDKLVKDPKKTIVIAHVPPYFKSKLDAIDVAYFGRPKKPFTITEVTKDLKDVVEGEFMSKWTIFPLEEAKPLIKAGYPVELARKNVGNEVFKRYLRKNKIKNFICGHIHESGHRGCDFKGYKIKSNKWNKELYYNASPSIKGRAGIYEVKNGLARFKNVKV